MLDFHYWPYIIFQRPVITILKSRWIDENEGELLSQGDYVSKHSKPLHLPVLSWRKKIFLKFSTKTKRLIMFWDFKKRLHNHWRSDFWFCQYKTINKYDK